MEEMVNPGFWKGRRVLVTGHTGFKGAWLCLWLQELGAEVFGFALTPEQPSMFEDVQVSSGMTSLIGDVRHFESLAGAVEKARPEIVFHLAAQSLVRRSYREPVATYATNVLGTVHLLEAVRHAKEVRAVVNVTSDKCYDNQGWVWAYRESDPLGGSDPYSSSKAAAELVTKAYRDSFFPAGTCAIASARAGNVIGGGDWAAERLIPDIIRAVQAGDPVQIRNQQAVRPWQHVLEPLNGYMMLAQKLFTEGVEYASAWNFGPPSEDARPVSWIVEQCLSRWGAPQLWTPDTREHPHEASYLKLDSAKAASALGWRSRWSLDRALDAVIEWYKSRQRGADLRSLTLRQIRDYSEPAPVAASSRV